MEFEIEYPFEELGFPLKGGWAFGNFEGTATIIVSEDGDWAIGQISVEKLKLVGGKWLRRPHTLDPHGTDPHEAAYFNDLCAALEASHVAAIEERVREALREREPITYESTISAGRTL
jgi:hypothetical protein